MRWKARRDGRTLGLLSFRVSLRVVLDHDEELCWVDRLERREGRWRWEMGQGSFCPALPSFYGLLSRDHGPSLRKRQVPASPQAWVRRGGVCIGSGLWSERPDAGGVRADRWERGNGTRALGERAHSSHGLISGARLEWSWGETAARRVRGRGWGSELRDEPKTGTSAQRRCPQRPRSMCT